MNPSDDQLFHTKNYGKGGPQLLIELPHGAVNTEEYQFFAQQIPSLPENLIDFFYVNTDVGTPELAHCIAQNLKEHMRISIIRSRIPRTLVDCNRVLSLSPEEYRAGKVTPGIPCYVPQQDHEWLHQIHQRYTKKVDELYASICQQGGSALILHSYSPKSVGISSVDQDIVEKLHWAYEADLYKTWPTRPKIDIIAKTKEGEWLCDMKRAEKLQQAYIQNDITVGLSQTYPMHPSTMAFRHAKKYPSQIICLEIRRDLLMKEFLPFAPMYACQKKIEKHAQTITKAYRQ